MIDLMLYDTSCEICETHSIGYAFRVQILHLHPAPSLDFTWFSWDRETSLFIWASLLRMFDDLRIYHRYSTEVFILIIVHEWYDDDSFIYSCLRCCESDSSVIRVFYMFQHTRYKLTIGGDLIFMYGSTYSPKYSIRCSFFYFYFWHDCREEKENILGEYLFFYKIQVFTSISMIAFFRKLIPLSSPIRLTYHYIRWVMAYLLSGNPARDMIVIGITGTKWKTTTSNLVARGLIASGKKVAMFSTVNSIIGDIEEENTTKMTTPSPFAVWNFIARARKAGCEYLVMETSSHALYYYRVHWLRYDVAVMTNISQDHLDLHGTMDNYIDTKLQLFKNLYKYGIRKEVRKVWIINIDNEYASRFLSKDIVVDAMHTFGFSKNASLRADNLINTSGWISFDIRMPSNTFHIDSKLQWEFNAMNILAATAVLISQKVSIDTIIATMKIVWGIPWRLEEVPNTRWAKIFVDYAHTEDSLKNVLETLRKIEGTKRIITLFWATGDRDKTKRPKMWRIVDLLSDVIILTDDDTYTEDSLAIIRDVSGGIDRHEGESFWIVPDRADALRTALLMLSPGDVLLAAGKWAEIVQVTQAGSIPWNDRKMIEKILMEIEAQVMI